MSGRYRIVLFSFTDQEGAFPGYRQPQQRSTVPRHDRRRDHALSARPSQGAWQFWWAYSPVSLISVNNSPVLYLNNDRL